MEDYRNSFVLRRVASCNCGQLHAPTYEQLLQLTRGLAQLVNVSCFCSLLLPRGFTSSSFKPRDRLEKRLQNRLLCYVDRDAKLDF